MARNKLCITPKTEDRQTLMPVSPIEEKTEMEGLCLDGETEEAQEKERQGESMLDRGPASTEEREEEGGERVESCEGMRSVGRRSPKEPTKVEKEEHERTHCPYRR